MVELSKLACLYVLMCYAWTLVWTLEQICLRLCIQIRRCGPIHLYHPLHSHQTLHSWDFYHSWDFSCHCFYTVTFLIGYHCIPWYWSTPLHPCDDWLYDADFTSSIVLYLHSASFYQITVLLVSRGDVTVTCDLCNYLQLLFHIDGMDLPLRFLQNSDTCIPRRWHISSSVHPAKLCYLYSAAMVHIFMWFARMSYCASCTSLMCSCTMHISYDTARTPWCLILYCILVSIPCGSLIFFLNSCCSFVLLHSLLVSWCDSMSIFLVFVDTHSLLCVISTPGILCSRSFPGHFWTFLLCLWYALVCLCWEQTCYNFFNSVCLPYSV